MLLSLLRLVGIDRAIGYGLLNRFWSALAGPVTIIIIASRFSKVQQGYFYTFSSLLALQVFFELGLLMVIAQFASHEFAFLVWGGQGAIHGEPASRDRFLDLLCKSVKWYAVSAVILVCVLVPAGLYFFGRNQTVETVFAWRLPWILAVLGIAGNLLLIPFYAVILGSGDVVTVNKREMLGRVVGILISWLVIGLNGGLYAVVAVTSGDIIIGTFYLLSQKQELLKSVISRLRDQHTKMSSISWRHEVWPLQWKIAISWVSGYFIFQLFTPVLFHYYGPVSAGQMGMTLSASNALQAMCMTWLNAKSPEFGKLIALKKWNDLDNSFRQVMMRVVLLSVIGAIGGWSIIKILQDNYPIGQRFIPATYAALLFAAITAQVIVNGFAMYLRAHKEEPLFMLSVLVAIIQGSATWLLGKKFGSLGVVSSFLSVTIFFTLPFAFVKWTTLRRRWHNAL